MAETNPVNMSRLESDHGALLRTGLRSLHPTVRAKLGELGLDAFEPPSAGPWAELVDWVDRTYRELDELRHLQRDVRAERSSFENLFHNSPIPIMEQDYSRLEDWMAERRRSGHDTLESALGGTAIENIRSVVPLVEMVSANAAARRAVGLPLEEMLGPIEPRIVNPGSENGWLNQLRAVWDRAPVAHAVFVAATADGIDYDAESILAAPLIDGEPDFSRAVFTIIDVTPHRNEERRMQELVEAKDRFLASVSHEVRTPLTAILGFARLLEEGGLDGGDREAMVSMVADHAQEVSDLIEDLLVAARVDSGHVQVVNVSGDVVSELRDLLRVGGSFTRSVRFSASVEEAWAWFDPSRLRQVLRNLLTNAERYGGDNVDLTVAAGAESVVVEVVDDGPGLPPEEWEKIFEPYHRVHQTPGLPGSVGIGLTISRQLAELMNGRLEYRVEDGMSRFRLELQPATPAAEPSL